MAFDIWTNPKKGNIFDLGSKPKSKPIVRDSRRNFSLTQKKQILSKQHNKCAKCRRPLDFIVAQFDHIKAWELGGKTTVANGRALHADCHMRVTHLSRLKKIDKKRKSKPTRESNPFDTTFNTGGLKW